MRLATLSLFLFTICSFNSLYAQVPVNDDCANAIAVTCGETVSGNTTEATADANAIACGTSIGAPGIWYSFQGNDQAVTLSTCSNFLYDTKLNVYTGSCEGLVCVTGNDDGGNCDVGSTVGFPAMSNTTYFILVQGYDGEVGEFDLVVSCGPITSDFCSGAEAISCNQSLAGSTLEATPDQAPNCVTGIQAAGVWYSFTGIEDAVVINTCESFDYDTRINVYSGSCNALVCVTGNDDTPEVGECSTVNFLPDPALTYYILVQGYQGQTGTFSLELACQTCPAPTDVTASASDVTGFVQWQSLNLGATYVIEYGPLGFTPGDGQLVTGSVMAPASAMITGLAPGTEYVFFLHEECGEGDISGTVGLFTFTTLTDPPPANSTCTGALPIACDGTLTGDTETSFFSPGATCGAAPFTSKSLWYTFVGDGSTVTLSTCGTADFDTKISVLNGNCEALLCVSGNDDAPGCANNSSQVVFPSAAGTTYFVVVHGYNEQAGTFTLSMTCAPTCSPLAVNDQCSNATMLDLIQLGSCEGTTGDNSCAFADGTLNPPCDEFAPIVDVWYAFNTGEHTDFRFVIEAGTATTLNGALYGSCNGLDFFGCQKNITAPLDLNGLDLNTTYYVRLWNSGGADAGTFSICVETDLSTIGIDETNGFGSFHVWPNPANDQLMIDGHVQGRINVVDLQGRIVLTTQANLVQPVQMDISKLAPGSYVLRAMDGDAGTIGRFVKE